MTTLFDSISWAHAAVRPQVPVSPLHLSRPLSAALGCSVLLKNEHLQPTGSFKIRGATNKIQILGEAARRTGVTTASTGNHGQAVARAGSLAGVPVTVYVAASAAQPKVDAIRALGAELVVVNGPPIEAELLARRHADEQGKIYISPYNDLDVIAGQGTLGMELVEQAPELDAVFISVGGGGLISGVGTALKNLSPRTRVIGVWPENSPCMLRAMEAGAIVDVDEKETLSDGTAGAVEPGSVTLPLCRAVIDETITVSEADIGRGMRMIADAEHWIVEGSAGVALAGLARRAEAFRGKKVAVVLCGRNIALERFLYAIELAIETG
ncbi:MAG TPA: threonine/serine dehydratase [Steroidobacteraceae bacterium]|nr:threonine/serine dehydratase [Steroidobacteraceae bacterium]